MHSHSQWPFATSSLSPAKQCFLSIPFHMRFPLMTPRSPTRPTTAPFSTSHMDMSHFPGSINWEWKDINTSLASRYTGTHSFSPHNISQARIDSVHGAPQLPWTQLSIYPLCIPKARSTFQRSRGGPFLITRKGSGLGLVPFLHTLTKQGNSSLQTNVLTRFSSLSKLWPLCLSFITPRTQDSRNWFLIIFF